jgi:hypothetical protein
MVIAAIRDHYQYFDVILKAIIAYQCLWLDNRLYCPQMITWELWNILVR